MEWDEAGKTLEVDILTLLKLLCIVRPIYELTHSVYQQPKVAGFLQMNKALRGQEVSIIYWCF